MAMILLDHANQSEALDHRYMAASMSFRHLCRRPWNQSRKPEDPSLPLTAGHSARATVLPPIDPVEKPEPVADPALLSLPPSVPVKPLVLPPIERSRNPIPSLIRS